MRITLSSLSVCIATSLAFGQGDVVVQVLTPASIADSYSNTFAVAASGWDAIPDITLPANVVQDTLAFGFDGTAADSLGCEPLVNPQDVNGQIAVIYRGSCPFSQKALNAQNAGARALLLFSNGDELNINMQGGTLGPQITIPVVMISRSSGELIRPVMDAETVTALIGNNFGLFPDNLNLGGFDILVPSAACVPELVAQNADEYQVDLGGFIHNFGSETSTTARLRAVITNNGSEVYNESVDAGDIPPGDSVLVLLPQFTQPSYTGEYLITYTAESDATDGFPDDNSYSVPLLFSDLASYVPVDAATNLPQAELTVVPLGFDGFFRSCIAFADTNASRLAVTGLHFAGRTPTDLSAPVDTTLQDMFLVTYAYLWTDQITSPFTVPTDAGLTTLSNGSYTYPDNLQGEMVFIPFDDAVVLDDNQRYLFCVETSDSLLRHGWNEDVNYDLNADFSIEPVSAIRNGQTWFNGFSGLGGAPAIGIKVINENSIGINEEASEVELTPYPNPTQDLLRIPMKGMQGATALRIFSTDGSLVAEQRPTFSGEESLVVDLSKVGSGTYLFHLEFENGQHSEFRVVVAK